MPSVTTTRLPRGSGCHVGRASLEEELPCWTQQPSPPTFLQPTSSVRARSTPTSSGRKPIDNLGGVALIYKTVAGSTFSVYQTEYAGEAGHTIAQWHVDDVASAVDDLRSKGVTLEHDDTPGAEWVGDVA